MLILSAKPKRERIVVDDRVEIAVLKVLGDRVWLAIHGVDGTIVDRLEVAKSKRDYESPFDELFERLKGEPDERNRPASASTLREHKERRRNRLERRFDELALVAPVEPEETTTDEPTDGSEALY